MNNPIPKISNNSGMTLRKFIASHDQAYADELKKIPLFNPEKSRLLSFQQKQYVAKVFYHLRGHFHDFLWILGNFAPTPELKDIVIKNIAEEFGYRCSHEELYIRFAEAFGVNILHEISEETSYLPFARAFNYGHKKWLVEHNWDEKLCAFAAYERLDNVDYPHLFNLANSFDLSEKQLAFFRVHMTVTHFENTEEQIAKVWHSNNNRVMQAFYFIYGHQLQMWKNLSEVVFNYGFMDESSSVTLSEEEDL